MPKSTMNNLGITMEELPESQMVIQGFSLKSQRPIGMIRLELMMGDLSTSSIFHVIDSKTSYKLLLGRPWLHEHGIVASTLYQCLKYIVQEKQRLMVMLGHSLWHSHISLMLNFLKKIRCLRK